MNDNKKLNHLSQIELPNDNKTYFCLNCKDRNLYVLDTEKITLTIKGVTFTYEELQPYCINCGEPIYVPEIHDINQTRKLQAYEKEIAKPFTTNSNTVFPNQKIYISSSNK